MTHDKTSEVFEKKTERLDIRLSHQKKQAFSEACENQGDTPSHAVRRFITTYVRRAHQDDVVSAIRFSPWKRRAAIAGGFLGLAIVGVVVWGQMTVRKSAALTATLFDIYDGDKNGLIDLGEISPDDFHLNRVLNIDGQLGISKAEFVTHGTMIWNFVDPKNLKIVENSDSAIRHRVTTVSTVGLDGNPIDPGLQRFVKIDGEFVELDLENEDQYSELILSGGATMEDFRNRPERSDAMKERLKYYSKKIVKFDLRNPDKFELSVLEQQPTHAPIKTISGYQRSVDWVEGRKTPELVMGLGRENAVLTQDVIP